VPQKSSTGVAIPATPLSRHGLLTTAQLRESGLSQGAIWYRVRRGALFRRYHGVYSLSPGELSQEGEWTAALMAAGDGATLSDVSAAVLSRIWRYPEEAIDITLPRRHVPIPGVHLHQRKLDPLDVFVFDGIRVTTVARTLVDLTDELLPEELTSVIHEAAFHKRFDLAATERAMGRANGRHKLRVLEQAIDDWLAGSAGLKSRKERAFLVLVAEAGLPRPRVNARVEGIEVDFHWPRDGLVVEVDGDHHRRPPTRRADERRDAELRAAGWVVLRFTPNEIERQRERVLAAVECALARPQHLSGASRR
jgi:very-short-patch-repair endonuclease